MSVVAIDEKRLWDQFIDDSPYGSIFHRWDFLKAVEKHTGYKLLPYGIYRGNELISVFPLYFQKYRGMRLLFSPPRRTMIPYLGFVMGPTYDGLKQRRKESYINAVADEMDREIRKLSPNFVSVYTVPNFEDIRPFKWNAYGVNVGYEYRIDLNRSLDEIWAGFDPNCKKSIKHCAGLPLELRRINDTRTFAMIMAESLTKKGQKYQALGPAYIEDLLAAFPENIRMYFLYNQDEIAGMQTICDYKSKLTLWLGNASGHFNEYLIWEFIKDSKSRGLAELEIPGGDVKRLTPFKSKFNPCVELDFLLTKKDTFGALGEWAFRNVVKGWI